MRAVTITLIVLGQAALSVASENSSPPTQIRFEKKEETLFVCGNDIAGTIEFDFKVVSSSLVTFCKEGDNGICIPVRLTAANHRIRDNEVMLASDESSKALRHSITEDGGRIVVQKNARPRDDGGALTTAGYSSDWGQGRGFQSGDTLPDIPLVDLNGQEVRFSTFLGKRYILYVWASW